MAKVKYFISTKLGTFSSGLFLLKFSLIGSRLFVGPLSRTVHKVMYLSTLYLQESLHVDSPAKLPLPPASQDAWTFAREMRR